MNSQKREGPLRKATKGVGALIGLAAEAHAHRKDKKTRSTGDALPVRTRSTASSSGSTDESRSDGSRAAYSSDSSITPLDDTEKGRQLGEEDIDDLLPPTYDEAISPTLVSSPSSTTEITPLPLPIIVPQRRPRSATRGFLPAYSPLLQTHKSISQDQLLTFLKDFHSSTQVSPVLRAVNIGAMAAGFAPSAIAMAVSMGVQVTVRMAMVAQVKGRTNSFIEKANKEIFWPVGCHAMITTFMPGQVQQVVDVNVNNSLRQNSANGNGNGNGTGQSLALPQSAPLILIEEEATSDAERSSWKRSSSFVTEYFDKRAQSQHPDAYNTLDSSNTSTNTTKPKFASRFSDPNHPVNSGNPISLLTGGIVNPRSWQEKCGGSAALLGGGAEGGLLSKVQEIKQSRDNAGPIGLLRSNISSRSASTSQLNKISQPEGLKQVVRKATTMQRDVLYLVIAEIPDDVKEEMRRMERS